MTMQIRVLLFAQLADAVGSRSLDLDLPDDANVADALDALAREHASIYALRDRIAVAINEAYARPEKTLANGDTLALIPPVSGG